MFRFFLEWVGERRKNASHPPPHAVDIQIEERLLQFAEKQQVVIRKLQRRLPATQARCGDFVKTKNGNTEATFPCEICCPITLEVFRDPVLAVDGFTYEREAILAWFATGSRTSPVTREEISDVIFSNYAVRNLVCFFYENHQREAS